MPSVGEWTWSAELDALIREEADAAGVPIDLAYTFIAVESAFNPRAQKVDALEDSHGLLQLNRRGGQGAGYSVEQLLDPRTNLRIGLPYIRRAYEATWREGIDPFEFIYLVSIRSGHPGQVPRNDSRIYNIARAWSLFYPAAGISLQGPGPGVPAIGGAGPTLAAAVVILPVTTLMLPLVAAYNVAQVGSALALKPSLRPQLLALSLIDPRRTLPSYRRPQRQGRKRK